MIYAMSGETKGLPKLLHILSEVVNRPVFSPEEVSVTACFDGETIVSMISSANIYKSAST